MLARDAPHGFVGGVVVSFKAQAIRYRFKVITSNANNIYELREKIVLSHDSKTPGLLAD